MKTIFFSCVAFFLSLEISFADAGIFGNFKGDATKSAEALRNGDIHTDDIPTMIKNMVDFLMTIAGTIAVIFVILWAYQVIFKARTQNSIAWLKTIQMALTWFALSGLAWFIIKIILDNFN